MDADRVPTRRGIQIGKWGFLLCLVSVMADFAFGAKELAEWLFYAGFSIMAAGIFASILSMRRP